MSKIVVGVDGSDGSRRALKFAAEEARLRGLPLHAVMSCHFPQVIGPPGAAFPVEHVEEVEERARLHLEEILTEELGEHPGITIERSVRSSRAIDLLLEATEGATLLVLGSRGLGGFRGLLLGSVGQQLTTHAPCPVTIVPDPQRASR
jgi:nucleotide-binding universal stress UspA family protein